MATQKPDTAAIKDAIAQVAKGQRETDQRNGRGDRGQDKVEREIRNNWERTQRRKEK